ncbi:hypothetical protein LOZ80_31645 [Paenibacillus sp. HWE-109]|uniref:hypothetical protein n=1 Tax=Paenibacillus sp. HWE-109 TaxID=1306526 RepID=UPI001EDD58AF|nr:hypothetical protein [Paenibacillus sp. HWE-109]UKS26058.1 hypothetical protein LOZ80_31645 [Paenibacillus sp. HWE-109]
MPRRLTIYLGMAGALLLSIASLMNWQALTVIGQSAIYEDDVVDFAKFLFKYKPLVLCLSAILIGMFFINFSWEFGQQKSKVVSSLQFNSRFINDYEVKNTYSIIFKFIGVATIVIGFLSAIYLWTGGIDLPRDKSSVFLFGLVPLLYSLLGGLIFMGFGEVLKLLQQIRDKNTTI